MEEARKAGALQVQKEQGQWKARLSEAETAHAEEVQSLQRRMRQGLEQAQRQAADHLADVYRWEGLT